MLYPLILSIFLCFFGTVTSSQNKETARTHDPYYPPLILDDEENTELEEYRKLRNQTKQETELEKYRKLRNHNTELCKLKGNRQQISCQKFKTQTQRKNTKR